MLNFLSLLWQRACFFSFPFQAQNSGIKSHLFRLEMARQRGPGLTERAQPSQISNKDT